MTTNRVHITDADIAKLTRDYLNAVSTAAGSRITYLRALVETTIREIGATPRTSPPRGRQTKMTPETTASQLAALQATHERFYAIVIKVASEDLPAKDQAAELNRRTNFARTALYSARLWVRAGNDLTVLVVQNLTKAALAVKTTPRAASARQLRGRVERRSKAVMAAILALEDTDKAAAMAELNTLMGQLASRLISLEGGSATTDPKIAAAEHRPLRVGTTVFTPTETQILRQQARPS